MAGRVEVLRVSKLSIKIKCSGRTDAVAAPGHPRATDLNIPAVWRGGRGLDTLILRVVRYETDWLVAHA